MSQFYFENVVNYKRPQYVADNLSCKNRKDVYLTYADAYRALEQRSKPRKEKKAVYRCSMCGHYHLHSKDGVSNRHIKYSRSIDAKIYGKKKFLVPYVLLSISRNLEYKRFYQFI